MSQQTTDSLRVDVALSEGVAMIAEEFGVSKSELIRAQYRELINDHENVVEEYQKLQAKLNDSKKRSSPFMNVMHLPNNLHEELRSQIDKPYPAPFDEVLEHKYKPYKSVIETRYGDDTGRKGRAMAKLDHAMRMYEILHPETDDENARVVENAVAHYALAILEEEGNDMDDARAFVSRRVDEGVLPEESRDEVFDRIRDTRREEWQSAWKDGVQANWSES